MPHYIDADILRNEIERLKGQLIRGACAAQIEMRAMCKEEAYDEVLSFLSTLESGKPMNQEGVEEELDKWRHSHFNGKRDGHFSGEYLERTSQLELARHFAQWQKEQMLKDAVEYEVWDFSSSLEAYPHVNIPLDNKQYRNGDKVRVIVLPKED